ncbi:Zinc finger protein RFP [Chelonia mydas]|uniref:Zinc finger protein RFP n=1 Tax=Chelonia mydas TaxID=8469 RepID=M7BZS4_CHEMY|nr:Zinc finger protein RFP [Chelonia mydas]
MITLESTKEPEVGRVCEKHNEDLKIFCQEDQIAICMVCHLSRDHREHTAVPIEEAAADYKKQLETEKRKIVSEFQQLCQFLEEQKQLLLAQLEKLNKEIKKRRAEYVAKLSEEISSFSHLISEMEQKCQQTASEFLQNWCQDWAVAPGVRGRDVDRAKVTLDPDTAHPQLILSADRRSVRWGDTRQALPENPERFDTEPCVLGCEGFTSGRHYWEVEVEVEMGGRGVWAVGVARECVGRKGRISFTPEQGIWALQGRGDQYRPLMSPEQLIPLSPSQAPRRIRVYLDYEGGRVVFFDTGRRDPIVTFPPAAFAGETIRPFFHLGHSGSPFPFSFLLRSLHKHKYRQGRRCQLALCP